VAEKDAGKGGKEAGKDAPKDAAAEAPKKGKGKLIVIVAAVLLLAGGGGAAAWLMLGKKPDESAAKKVEPKKTPVFVELDTFTVNLKKDAADEAERFMQVKLVAEVKDTPTGELVKTMMPAVRSEIILLLGSKRADEVASREGKEKLAGEIVLAANKPLERTPAEKGVEGVNFTHIIVQ
jgi:flagellar FliL protein